MNMRFKIGSICFELDLFDEMQIPDNFIKFRNEDCEPEYYYEIQLVDQLPIPIGKLIHERIDLVVFEQNGLEERYIGTKNPDSYYAYYKESDHTHIQIKVLKSFHEHFKTDTFFTSLFALEKRAIDKNEVVLHTAFIEYEGKAILFSAPSETGKTTQANLWGKYRDARTINGDRSLLTKKENVWTAGGWPVCGSSEICHDISMPIRAIVMLSQAKKNSIERLHPMKAFSQVYSQITINRWNKEVHAKAMNLIENLITEVPIYHLACNISEDAVKCLEQKLESTI